MDALSEILSGIRLSGSAFFDAELSAPWSVQTPTGAEIAKRLAPGAARIIPYHLIVEGACSLRLGEGPPLAVEAREVICFPHGDVHQLASSADLEPTIPTEAIVGMTRADEVVPVTHGGGGSTTRFVCGFFACASALSDRIVTPLPRVLKFRVGDDSPAMLLPKTVREARSGGERGARPGTHAMLCKLSELLFVEAVRSYIDTLDDSAGGWLVALKDRHVSAALALMHGQPACPWTLEMLAERIGASRSMQSPARGREALAEGVVWFDSIRRRGDSAMDRRTFISAAAFGVFAASRAARAQQPGKVYRIGFLGIANASAWASQIAALRQGLRELGYEEGVNLMIEYRWAEEDFDRLPKLASELVSLKLDVIVTHGTPGSRAAKQATTTIPVVMAAVGDPVRSGLVASLARPGGNLTGNSIVEFDLALKRLELVKEVVPAASRVALFYVPGTQIGAIAEAGAKAVDDAGARLGMQVHRFAIRDSNELPGASATMEKERTDALIVRTDALLAAHYGEIARLAVQHRVPTVGGAEQFVGAGGLFAYGVNVGETYRHAAVFVDKILRGAKPADLPIEQPTKYALYVNLTTAKALGLTIPQSLLLRADEVIQ